MKLFLLSGALCLVAVGGAHAQAPTYRHSLGVGFERVGLDAPDAIGNRGLLHYARYLGNGRLVLGGDLGYVNVLNRRYLVNDFYVDGKRRERVTADVTLAFDFIKHARHALRLGAGPSLWYRQDELMNGAHFTLSSSGEVSNVRVAWRQEKEVNYGFNTLLEYEYALTSQLLVSGKLKVVSVNNAGQSSIYGVGVGYRLP